jgi:TPR repeat protein
MSKFIEAGSLVQTADVGTPLYSAPEICRGDEDYDFSVDIYAYGVLVYATISGLSPFEELGRISGFNLMRKVAAGVRPAIPKFLKERPWGGLIESCWAQDPRDRITFEGVVRAMGDQDFVGGDVDVDRLLAYQRRVAAPEFFSRASCHPKPSGRPKSPFDLLMEAADSGDAVSQAICGYRFYVGDGVPLDFAKAANYFKMSADQGYAAGQYRYGVCLEKGRGVIQNFEQAAEYYRKAADQGNAAGQYNYGLCLANGRGVIQNFEQAAEYYRKAADQGNAAGQYNYGVCLQKGRGVIQNFEQAAEYYRKAADQGHADAAQSLRRLTKNPTCSVA